MIAKILDINIKHSLLKKFLRSATAKFFFFFFSTPLFSLIVPLCFPANNRE